MHIIRMGNRVVRSLMYYRMIITGTRMRRLCLMAKKGREIMRIGRYLNGGGKADAGGWIDSTCRAR